MRKLLIVAARVFMLGCAGAGYAPPMGGFYGNQPYVIFTPSGNVIHCVPAGMGNYGCW